METRSIGKSGLKVSTICLGAMTFGVADETSFMHGIGSDEETSFSILDRALEKGVTFIDVADVYGQDGLSERVVGSWLDARKTRDRIVLATKFRFRMWDGPNGSGASRYRIVRTVEESLRRLRTDRIDLYQIHAQDPDTPEEETLRALDDLVRAGKVLYLGASNYAAYRLVGSLWTSRTERLERFIALQASYSLAVRDLERELVPLCLEQGLGILPYSPLAGGLLSGKYEKGKAPPKGARLDKWKDRLENADARRWRIVETLQTVSAELGTTPPRLAIAWVLGRPGVTSVIIGARTVAQLEDNLLSADLKLDDATLARLDEASAFELGYPYEMLKRVTGRW